MLNIVLLILSIFVCGGVLIVFSGDGTRACTVRKPIDLKKMTKHKKGDHSNATTKPANAELLPEPDGLSESGFNQMPYQQPFQPRPSIPGRLLASLNEITPMEVSS